MICKTISIYFLVICLFSVVLFLHDTVSGAPAEQDVEESPIDKVVRQMQERQRGEEERFQRSQKDLKDSEGMQERQRKAEGEDKFRERLANASKHVKEAARNAGVPVAESADELKNKHVLPRHKRPAGPKGRRKPHNIKLNAQQGSADKFETEATLARVARKSQGSMDSAIKVVDTMSNVGDQINRAVNDADTNMQARLNNATGTIKKILVETSNKSEDAEDKAPGIKGKNKEDPSDLIRRIVEEAAEQAKETVERAGDEDVIRKDTEKAAEFVGGRVQEAYTQADIVVNDPDSIIQKRTDDAADLTKKVVDISAKEVAKSTDQMDVEVAKTTDRAFGEAKEAIDQAEEEVGEATARADDVVAKTTDRVLGEAKEAMDQAEEEVGEATARADDVVKKATDRASRAVRDAIDEATRRPQNYSPPSGGGGGGGGSPSRGDNSPNSPPKPVPAKPKPLVIKPAPTHISWWIYLSIALAIVFLIGGGAAAVYHCCSRRSVTF